VEKRKQTRDSTQAGRSSSAGSGKKYNLSGHAPPCNQRIPAPKDGWPNFSVRGASNRRFRLGSGRPDSELLAKENQYAGRDKGKEHDPSVRGRAIALGRHDFPLDQHLAGLNVHLVATNLGHGAPP